MKQVYHPTAVTNVHIRRQIKESSLTNFSSSSKPFILLPPLLASGKTGKHAKIKAHVLIKSYTL
jgi:hypothetical protein